MSRLKISLWVFCVLTPLQGWVATAAADTQDRDAILMRAIAAESGQISPSEQKLLKQSIQSTKQSVARETLDVFYHDALDFYRRAKYDEALDLLDNIYSVDPYYEDVATLRDTIRRLKSSHDIQSKRGILDDYMRKGNAAYAAGQSVKAINFWKQALVVTPSYEPAKRKIREVNKAMAQKQYEAGYLYYHRGDLQEALDSWSNALVLDPSYKQRGLLSLMSKVQLTLRKDQGKQLTARGYQQYAEKDLVGALQTYEELLSIDARNEEARRMASKIKIQLGQAAYSSARDSMGQQRYAQAIKQFQEAVRYGYEVQKAQKGIQDAERLVQSAREAKLQERNKPKREPAETVAAAPVVTNAPPPPVSAADAEKASVHYRASLAAIRNKDYHRAIEECEIASQLNPTDEHIYIACQRAKQEWNAASSGRGAQ